jgi:hypothetical protein
MSEKKTASIVIDDVEYTEDQLSDEQKILINHLMDLDRKINSTQFNLAQLAGWQWCLYGDAKAIS